jgi:hypothetical protein
LTQWRGWLIIIGTNENFCPSFLGTAQNWRFGFCFGAAIQCNLQLVEAVTACHEGVGRISR